MVGVLTFARTPVSRAAFREAMLPLWTTTTPDIRYGPFPRNVLDVLQPRAAQSDPRPIVIVFHGGAWRDGSRAEMRDRVCRRYLSQGFVVANVDYRPGIEESVEDAECALKWVSSNAERLEADPRRVVITGESAGAHLALLAAFQAPFPLAAVINFYGISDLMPLRDAEFVRRALRYERDDNAGVRLSPISYVHPGNPPTLSIHGTADATVPPEQTSTLTLRIRQSGGEAEEMWIAGGRHGFSESQLERAYDAVFDFLRRRGVIRS